MPGSTPIVRPAHGSIDPSAWRNELYPFFVVQARVRDAEPDAGEVRAPGGTMFATGLCDRRGLPVRYLAPDNEVQLEDGRTVAARDVRRRSVILDGGRVVHVDAVREEIDRIETVTPEGGVVVVERPQVVLYLGDDQCPGVDRQAASWVFLRRREALHAVYRHYAYPNMSICRFRSAARGDYAADLVFEIDAHDTVPAGCPITFFEPYIRAAVEVGRHLYWYIVNVLGVEPRYITTAISRMGARVTVDWRAFGPRRLFEILAVIRYIEQEVFGADRLDEIARLHGIPNVVVDTAPYERSDLPRPSETAGNAFIGPWLRPLGAVHTKSSDAAWWYRTIAVRRHQFHPDNASTLVKMSRAKGAPPPLRDTHLQAPESRLPVFDHLIEDDPHPAIGLIELFENDELLERIPADAKALVERLRRSATRPRRPANGPGVRRDLDDGEVRALLSALGANYDDKGDRYVFDCIVPTCKKGGNKASVHKASGVYWCWRHGCRQRVHLTALAAELGKGHLIPHGRHSSEPVQWVNRSDLPVVTPRWDRPFVEVVAPTCASIEEVWAAREAFLAQGMSDPDVRVMIDVSDTGLGKSHAARQLLRGLNGRYRVFCPRDDVKRDYGDLLEGAVVIQGRRLGENCTNDGLAEVTGRAEPVAETLCSTCPTRRDCHYRAAMKQAATTNTILAHQHGPFASFQVIDNGSVLDVVDEDALDAVLDPQDLDAEELRRMRTSVGYEHDFDAGGEDVDLAAAVRTVGLDVPGKLLPRAAATERIGRLLDRLELRLTHDAVVRCDARIASEGRIADLALGRLLFQDRELRRAVLDLGQDDVDRFEEERLGLVAAWQATRNLMVLPPEVETEWDTSPERAEARDVAMNLGADPAVAEMIAFQEWSRSRLVPASWPAEMTADIARPKAVFREFVEALQHLSGVTDCGLSEPTRLLAVRPRKAGRWVVRLTRRRPFLEESRKVLYLSATTTPVRAELLLGLPDGDAQWRVFAPRLPRRDVRTVIGDRGYTKTALLRDDALRSQFFETATALIKSEASRTGMPVALMGPTVLIALYLQAVLGDLAKAFKLNSKLSVARRAELRELTVAQGFVVGWAYGVAGSNDFCVEEGGTRRFLRSAVILGNPIPDLGSFADQHRGLFAEQRRWAWDENEIAARQIHEQVMPDWTLCYRAVPFGGLEQGDQIPAATNMMGFGDEVANEVLDGRYLAEIVQMAGRIRPYIPDPIEPTLEPRVFQFGAVAIPGWDVDRVVGLDDLRAELGLSVAGRAGRGRPSRKTPEQALRDALRKQGRPWVFAGLARQFLKQGGEPTKIARSINPMFEQAGLGFGASEIRELYAAFAQVLREAGRTADAELVDGMSVNVGGTP